MPPLAGTHAAYTNGRSQSAYQGSVPSTRRVKGRSAKRPKRVRVAHTGVTHVHGGGAVGELVVQRLVPMGEGPVDDGDVLRHLVGQEALHGDGEVLRGGGPDVCCALHHLLLLAPRVRHLHDHPLEALQRKTTKGKRQKSVVANQFLVSPLH
eukprot:8619963-Pyramimonas_sp.AAC.1